MKYTLPVVFLLVNLCCFSSSSFGQDALDEQSAFLKMLQLYADDTEKYMDEYTFRFNNDSYYLFKEDEFERHHAAKNVLKDAEKIAGSNLFYIDYTSEFGEYNFDNQNFTFTPFISEPKITIVNNILVNRQETNSEIKVFFLNGTEIEELPMNEDKANFLIKLRKNSKTGKVDREVYLRVYFMLSDNIEYTQVNEKRENFIFNCDIHTVEVYEKQSYNTQPICVIQTNAKLIYDAEQARK